MSSEARFSLSLDSVAAFRALRGGQAPEPLAVGLLAELAGVDGLIVHLRGDTRARRERDARLLREAVQSRLELCLSPATDLVSTAFDARPDRVTMVPQGREGGAPVGGLDVSLLKDTLRKHVNHLKDADIEVAARVEPALDQIKALHRLDVDVAVLFGGAYMAARGLAERRTERGRLADAATFASRAGLKVAVAGGLDIRAVEALAEIRQISEFHVGHACVARGLLQGIGAAIRDFKMAIERGRRLSTGR